MRRWSMVIAFASLFALLLPLGTAAQPNPVPGPVVRHQSRTEGLPISGPYDTVQFLLDFAPGAWTPLHTHGGKVLVTVIEGQVTRRDATGEEVYSVGEFWAEIPGEPHEAGNTTNAPATVFVTALLPAGAPLTTVEGTPSPNPPPGPVARYMYRTAGLPMTGAYEIVQIVNDFAPGAWTPPHTHGGKLTATVLAGELTYRPQGRETVYRAGESFDEVFGQVAMAGNNTSQLVPVAFSMVLPKGNPVTIVVPSKDCLYFFETKQSLCFGFRAYWETYGGLAIFGYPISAEIADSSGTTVQWFERARFEWSPGSWPERYDVLLGRIGAELAETRGIGLTP